MSDDASFGTSDTMRERIDESSLQLRILLETNRLVLAVALTAVIFVAFVVGTVFLSPPFSQQIQSEDTIETIFSTMLTVIVTGTTLVVTIGQLVLTQENGPLGDQHRRMSLSMDVRDFTAELLESPSPTDPAEFLSEIVGVAADRSRTLRELVGEGDDEPLRRDVDAFTDSLIENAETVRNDLDGARFGTFDVLSAALNFDYGAKIYQTELLDTKYDDTLSDEQRDALAELKSVLSMYGPAREHVKTLYFQWTLIQLSRMILYVAVLALAVAGVMVAVVDSGTFPGTIFGVDTIIFVVGAAFSVTLLPFMIFVSYILRVLTVAKRTLAIEPLILRDSE